MSTIAQENAAARAQAGVRTVTHEQLEALKNSSRTSEDVYANPPDPYARALDAGRQPAPTPPADPLDGYALAIARRKQEEEKETHDHN